MIPPTSIDGTDITGATIDGTDVKEITVDGQTVFSAGPVVAPVNKMYVGNNSNELRQYDMNVKFDLSAGVTLEHTLSLPQGRGVFVTEDGLHLYVSDRVNGVHEHYNLTTPYNISSRQFDSNLSTFEPHGIAVSPNGTNVLVSTDSGDTTEYYKLSTPHDLNSATFVDSENFGDDIFEPNYVNAGNFVYIADTQRIIRYDLSTPYDFTTRSNETIVNMPESSNMRGIHITEDGSKLFVNNAASDNRKEYILSTAYDIGSRGSPVTTQTEQNTPTSLDML